MDEAHTGAFYQYPKEEDSYRCEIPAFFEAYKSEKTQAYINPNWKHRMTGLGFYLGSHIFCWLKRLKTMGTRMDGY